MRLQYRLKRLEQCLGRREGDCPACRDRRGLVVVVGSRRLPDGTTTAKGEWPALCETCGEVPEQLIEIVEAVVETHEDVEPLADEGRTGQA